MGGKLFWNKKPTIAEMQDEIKHLDQQLHQEHKAREKIKQERDELLKTLQAVADEWDTRGKHFYRFGAPACIFKVKEKLNHTTVSLRVLGDE